MKRNMMGDFFELVEKSLEKKGYETELKSVSKIFHYIDERDILFLCTTSDVEMSQHVAKIIDHATDIAIKMHKAQMSYVKLKELQKS